MNISNSVFLISFDPMIILYISLIALVLLVVSIILCVMISSKISQKKREVYLSTKLDLNDSETIKLFYKWVDSYSHALVSKEFANMGKPTHTKKMEYRVDYSKEVAKKKQEYIHIFINNSNRLDDKFVEYCNSSFSEATRRDFPDILQNYIKEKEKEKAISTYAFTMKFEYVTPEVFFDIKSKQKGDVVGVYIIHNISKDMYYVGQAKRTFFRINQHLTGHGNGDVYADFKYGDKFEIKIVVLAESGYSDLDKLEKDLIDLYDAYNSGYNKTIGNSGN